MDNYPDVDLLMEVDLMDIHSVFCEMNDEDEDDEDDAYYYHEDYFPDDDDF